VRSALFNIWQGEIVGSTWLDICAGSGAMGAEALVLGASQVWGIEQSPIACQVIKQNWQKVAQPHQSWQVLKGDVIKILPKLEGQVFQLVYFDPPYQSDLYDPVLQQLHRLVARDSLIAVEHSSDRPLADQVGQLSKYDQRKYGQTMLSFYQLTPQPLTDHI
jgi:putative methyltransferase